MFGARSTSMMWPSCPRRRARSVSRSRRPEARGQKSENRSQKSEANVSRVFRTVPPRTHQTHETQRSACRIAAAMSHHLVRRPDSKARNAFISCDSYCYSLRCFSLARVLVQEVPKAFNPMAPGTHGIHGELRVLCVPCVPWAMIPTLIWSRLRRAEEFVVITD
jgi:hypothetical protein